MGESWVQPRGDATRRVDIPHVTAAAQGWQVDGAYTFFEGRRFPVGARGEHVSTAWSVTTVWPFRDRSQAEAFLRLLRDVALETDARLDVRVEAPPNGTVVEFVGEVHEIPQEIGPSKTDIRVTFREVDS